MMFDHAYKNVSLEKIFYIINDLRGANCMSIKF